LSSTLLPYTTLFRNPRTISVAKETLVYRCAGFSPALSLLIPTFAFLDAPACITTHLQRRLECSPTRSVKLKSTASVLYLMPDYYPRTVARLVSCYALFK